MSERGVIGWLLDEADRAALMARIAPLYPRVIAHHVTLNADPAPNDSPPEVGEAQVVGEADDGTGVQALVVRIDGTTARPDGSTYHITWSLADGRRARESNTVIAENGWRPLEPMAIRLTPGHF